MWIMIAGPYKSGSDDPLVWKNNLAELNRIAYQVFLKGHIPVIGGNNSLPLIAEAGEQTYDELMMPLSLAFAERCDAVLRTDRPSKGADEEMEVIKSKGRPVFYSLDEIPKVE